MNPPQLNVTIKWIDECITRAARFASTTIAGEEFARSWIWQCAIRHSVVQDWITCWI
jgi:hypothetical protein